MKRRIAAWAERPEFWLGLLLVWAACSGLRSWHTPWARVAETETFRWMVGIGLTLSVGHGLHRVSRLAQALTVGLGLLVAAAVLDGPRSGGMITGPYQDHQLCASALLALLPFAAALALAARQPVWRWGALAVTGAALTCLALTGTRAAWAGAALGALVFFWLWSSRETNIRLRFSRIALPLLLAVCLASAFLLFIHKSDLSQPLSARVATLGALARDGSWQWRLLAWRGAVKMIAQRPWVGWGMGRYPSAHWAFSPLNRPLAPFQRPSLSDEAHDFYLQTTVELGLIGLGLYLAALVSTARLAWKTLAAQRRFRSSSLRDALLAASLALITGQGVDAMASPSWQFAEVSLLFWLGLGLALAAARSAGRTDDAAPVPRPVRRFMQWAAVGSAAVYLTAQVLPIGLLSPAEAYDQPTDWTLSSLTIAGSQSSIVLPIGYVAYSQSVTYTMTAVYQTTDANGGTVYSAPMTFTTGSDCLYRDSSILSIFTNNVLTISKGDDPKLLGSSTVYTITGTLTDNSGSHSATTTLKLTND